ncbi:hypothetical protein RDI58_014898 [Solanum bulbocastanum]|uniref:DUF7081 domain-containing protein n=1 Tax=Solanum bulbocastanum TaxID=147425 RepID=A0AAN8YEF4_SOLBU
MSAKEEVGESLALVVYNGNASTINEIGLQLYPVSEYDSGEGLPYALMDWPNAQKDGKKNAFQSKTSVKKYLQSEYPSMDIDQFFASFSWMMPSKKSPRSKG